MSDRRAVCQLAMPNRAHFYDFIVANARYARRMLTQNSRQGQSVTICGAGPSLREFVGKLPDTDEVWGCNSAVPYLWDSRARLTHAVTIDQGREMLLEEEWGRVFPRLTYYLASSVHPDLTAHILAHNASVRWFHSFLGVDDPPEFERVDPNVSYEMTLYRGRFPTSVMVGHGLNTVPRAVCLALALGFSDIEVYGADCCCAVTTERMPARDSAEYRAWLGRLQFYADGRTTTFFGDTPMAEALFDGRLWHTRPDMVISAVHLLDLVREGKGAIRLHGDTLPNALATKDPAFLEQLPKLDSAGAVTNFGVAA